MLSAILAVLVLALQNSCLAVSLSVKQSVSRRPLSNASGRRILAQRPFVAKKSDHPRLKPAKAGLEDFDDIFEDLENSFASDSYIEPVAANIPEWDEYEYRDFNHIFASTWTYGLGISELQDAIGIPGEMAAWAFPDMNELVANKTQIWRTSKNMTLACDALKELAFIDGLEQVDVSKFVAHPVRDSYIAIMIETRFRGQNKGPEAWDYRVVRLNKDGSWSYKSMMKPPQIATLTSSSGQEFFDKLADSLDIKTTFCGLFKVPEYLDTSKE